MTLFQICTRLVFATQTKNWGGAGEMFPQQPPTRFGGITVFFSVPSFSMQDVPICMTVSEIPTTYRPCTNVVPNIWTYPQAPLTIQPTAIMSFFMSHHLVHESNLYACFQKR